MFLTLNIQNTIRQCLPLPSTPAHIADPDSGNALERSETRWWFMWALAITYDAMRDP
jgi:hypothetical protein